MKLVKKLHNVEVIRNVRKMKRIWFLLLVVVLVAFKAVDEFSYRTLNQESLKKGERIEYRVHYGLINAAEGIMQIDENVHWMNKRPCFKVDIYGRSTGFFDMVLRVKDNWGSYIDTSAILPQRFYRYIEEGKYRKKEIIDFHHDKEQAIVHRLDKHSGKLQKKDAFDIPENVQDLVSGYYYLRTFDFDTINKGEIFEIEGFFDDTTYQMKVQFLGRENLKTKVGNFDALVISPIMPKNSLFKGRDPIKAWLSDDKRKIPLKIKAELFIGALEIDIKDYHPGK